ncbi:MAG: serine/threonine protein kinase [Myxococcales bacterium]|nr:serine/threonine protein kinase [Myxococcales bacterium]
MSAIRELQRRFDDRRTERYTPTALLGRGGNGDVFRALDRHTGDEVAIKVLRKQGAESLRRFRAEFDAVASIAHRNLVALYELDAQRDPWFIVMEAIDGAPLLPRRASLPSQSRRTIGAQTLDAPTVDDAASADGTSPETAHSALPLPALAARFIELCNGVDALHAEGMLHLDLKPANVLFEPATERVVIVDLGLAHGSDDGSFALAGTPAYLSPELLAHDRPTTAADRYAIGVMLFEALAGRWPFGGAFSQILASKRDRRAPTLRELAPTVEIPESLRELSEALLDRDPCARPTLDEIRSVLRPIANERLARGAAHRPARPLDAPQSSNTTTQREALDAYSAEALELAERDRRSRTSTLGGPSTRATLALCEDRDDRRAFGRAITRAFESPSTRVIRVRCDAAARVRFSFVDKLLRACARYGAEQALAHEACCAVDELVSSAIGAVPVQRSIATIATLIDALAKRSALVFVVDEAQDADAESLSLINAIALRVRATTRWIFIAREEQDALEQLRGALAAAPSIAFDELAIAQRPRAASIELERTAQQREILGLLQVARGSLSVASLCAACAQRGGFRKAIRDLVLDGALSFTGPSSRDEGSLSLSRTTGLPKQSALVLQRYEARLVRALQTTNNDRPALARILETRGRRDEAMGLWEQQARRADDERRWDEALRCARRALDLATTDEDRARVGELFADLCVHCERRSEAGDAFARASSFANDPSKKRALSLRAAEQWMHCGRYDEGAALLDAVAGARMDAIFAQLSPTRSESDARAAIDARLEAGLVHAAGFGLVDPKRVVATHVENRALATLTRSDALALRVDLAQVLIDGAIGASRDRAARATLDRIDQRAAAMLAHATSEDERARLVATCSGVRGAYAVQRGRFAEGVALLDQSEAAWPERAAYSWDRSVAQHFRRWALYYLGHFSALAAAMPSRSWRAHERGDRFASLDIRTQHSVCAWLLADDAARAEAALEGALARIESSCAIDRSQALVYRDATVARVEIALYRGDAVKAFDECVRNLGRSPVKDYAMPHGVRVDTLVLRARAALAALAAGHAKLEARAALAATLFALEQERDPWAIALAAYLRGLAEARAGRRRAALAALSAAEGALDALGMRSFALCAATARRRVLGSARADREALEYFSAEGARDPRAFLRVFLPDSLEAPW